MKILKRTKGISRQEWLEARKLGIGGSDAAAICGVCKKDSNGQPYKTEITVYMDKTGQMPQNDEPSEAAYWGNALEDVVAKEFGRRTGIKTKRLNAIVAHPKHDFIIGNIDRLITGEKALLECKTTNAFMLKEWDEDKVPDEYIVQCQHYLAVTGLQKAYIAVLIGGQKFVWKVVERNDPMIDSIINKEVDFWENHVLKNVPPPITEENINQSLLEFLYPQATKESTRLPDDAEAKVALLSNLKERYKEIGVLIKTKEPEIKAMVGEYETAVCGGYTITWKNKSRVILDQKALKEGHPDIYKEYTKECASREFSIKKLPATDAIGSHASHCEAAA